METATDSGIMRIEVLNASGQPVSGATINVRNDAIGLAAFTEITDINGLRVVPVLPPAVQSYQVTISKDGYSTESTQAISVANPNPYKPHLTIELQKVTEATFIIDLLSDLQIQVFQADDSPAAGVGVEVQNLTLIGVEPDVYKYDPWDLTTNAEGRVSLADMEWGDYALTATVGGTDLSLDYNLDPGVAVQLYLTPHYLELLVKDLMSGDLIEDAMVSLTRIEGEIEQVRSSDDAGEIVFTNLLTGEYELEVEAPGYATQTVEIEISPEANSEEVLLISL